MRSIGRSLPKTDRPRRLAARFRSSWCGAAALLAAALALSAGAAAAADISNDDCLMCHSDRSLTRSVAGHESSVYVNRAIIEASVHRDLDCVSCHTDVRSIPHNERLAKVRCASCHGDEGDQLETSAHGQADAGDAAPGCIGCHGTHDVRPAARTGLTACSQCHESEISDYRVSVHGVAIEHGDTDAATCTSCHGAIHALVPGGDAKSPVNRANLARTCAKCHANRELVIRRKITIPQAFQLYENSVHGRSKNPKAATCSDCHGTHRLLRATDPASSIYRGNIAATCGRCHTAAAKAYDASIHAAAVRRGVTQAPVCTDCHGEHLIRGPNDPNSPVSALAVTSTCASCHEAQGIRETYGLPAGRLSTYEDSYHGLAAKFGSPVVANCASCHGHHEVLPSSDPRSSVNPKRLPQTCGRCHPGAGTRFAIGRVHVASASPSNPVLYTVRWIYLVLIFGTIGGMLLHNGADFVSKLRRHWARFSGSGRPALPESAAGVAEATGTVAPLRHGRRGEERWYLRMTISERVQHAMLAVSFFTLVFTGFALKFPGLWVFSWLVRLEHGYAWRSWIHRGAAVVMVAAAIYHVVYLFTRRGRGMLAAMLPKIQDVKDMVANVLYIAGLRSTPPAFDRFGYVEKAEYWALIWGTVVMTLTGLILWFENFSLRWFDLWVIDLATLIHYYEAWLAFLAIVVWHLYHTMANPDVYPMDWSWITGRISGERLQHEHRGEWERLEAESSE